MICNTDLIFSFYNYIFSYVCYIKYPVVLEYTARVTSRLTETSAAIWLSLLVLHVFRKIKKIVCFPDRQLRILQRKGYSITFIDYIHIQKARVGGERLVRLYFFAFEYKILFPFSYIKDFFFQKWYQSTNIFHILDGNKCDPS